MNDSIGKAAEKLEDLELSIARLLNDYTEETGMEIKSILIGQSFYAGYRHPTYSVSIDTRLPRRAHSWDRWGRYTGKPIWEDYEGE